MPGRGVTGVHSVGGGTSMAGRGVTGVHSVEVPQCQDVE